MASIAPSALEPEGPAPAALKQASTAGAEQPKQGAEPAALRQAKTVGTEQSKQSAENTFNTWWAGVEVPTPRGVGVVVKSWEERIVSANSPDGRSPVGSPDRHQAGAQRLPTVGAVPDSARARASHLDSPGAASDCSTAEREQQTPASSRPRGAQPHFSPAPWGSPFSMPSTVGPSTPEPAQHGWSSVPKGHVHAPFSGLRAGAAGAGAHGEQRSHDGSAQRPSGARGAGSPVWTSAAEAATASAALANSAAARATAAAAAVLASASAALSPRAAVAGAEGAPAAAVCAGASSASKPARLPASAAPGPAADAPHGGQAAGAAGAGAAPAAPQPRADSAAPDEEAGGAGSFTCEFGVTMFPQGGRWLGCARALPCSVAGLLATGLALLLLCASLAQAPGEAGGPLSRPLPAGALSHFSYFPETPAWAEAERDAAELPLAPALAALLGRRVAIAARGTPEAAMLPSAAGRLCPLTDGTLALSSYPEGLLFVLRAEPRADDARDADAANASAAAANASEAGDADVARTGAWGALCARGQLARGGRRVADVACRQLGYSLGALGASAGGVELLLAPQDEADGRAGANATAARNGTRAAPRLSPALAELAAGMPFSAGWLQCSGREGQLRECAQRPARSEPTGEVPPCAHPADDVVLRCKGLRDRVYAAREDMWVSCAGRVS